MTGRAEVYDSATVAGLVCDNARVHGSSVIGERVHVCDNAEVYDASVIGRITVSNVTEITGKLDNDNSIKGINLK